ncbi:MAG: L,D-transpeptidase [Clostridia bacterium]|nr:L,D-transpeptidase [Clostridia bacterium]
MKKRFALLCVLACALLCACAGGEKTAVPQETPQFVPTQEPVVFSVSEATPAPTPVPTPEPTATPEPTPTPTPTPVPFDDAWKPKKAPKEDGQLAVVVYFGTQSAEVFRAENGEWQPLRRMICSTGKRTPTGTYGVGTKYDYHKLYGAYGQWCARITGHILFHSVPIDEKARKQEVGMQRMKLGDYEALGTPASDGCIRLCAADAKWVHDNTDRSTVVVLTEDNGPEPPAVPALIKEAPYMTAEGYGWDPTDPNPDNPYLAVYGTYEGNWE